MLPSPWSQCKLILEIPKPQRSKRFGFDGAHWIIESLAANKYHVADRWAPNKSDFAEIGKFLISLTDMDLTEGEVY